MSDRIILVDGSAKTHEEMGAFLEGFIQRKVRTGWPTHELDAARAGWDYVMDMTYNLSGPQLEKFLKDVGQSEAWDMADCTIMDPPWGHRDRDLAADCIYEGMCAARDFLTYGSLERKREVLEERRQALVEQVRREIAEGKL